MPWRLGKICKETAARTPTRDMAFVWSVESPGKIPHLKCSFRKSQGESDSKYFWNLQHSRPSAINYFCKDRKGSMIVVIRASDIKRWMVISTQRWTARCHGTIEDCHQSDHNPVSRCISRPEGIHWIHRGLHGILNSLLYHPAERHTGPIYLEVICLPFHTGKDFPEKMASIFKIP